MKIILETDIGHDPDDFITLNLTLSNPNIDLKGIIVDPGDSEQIGLVRSILEYHEHSDIPIGGLIESSIPPSSYVTTRHKKCLSRFGIPIRPSKKDLEGHELMDDLIEQYPDLVLITIGPLKNFKHWEQKSENKINQSYTMGGYFGDAILGQNTLDQEYNFNAEVTGAHRMIHTNKIKRKVFVSKNVTHYAFYTPALHESVKLISDKSKGHKMIYDIMETGNYYEGQKKMHDPLTLCVAQDESIVQLKECYLYNKNDKWGSYECPGTNCFISVGNESYINHDKFNELFLSIN